MINDQTNPAIEEHALDVAARIAGGRAILAKKLGVSQAAIGNWKMRDRIPLEHCPTIEILTGGVVTRRELCPLKWEKMWPELAQDPASPAPATTDSVAQGL